MENAAPQTTAIRVSQKPLRPEFSLHMDEPAADIKDLERSVKDELVLDILESTHSIRRRTDNREILGILDEIAWLARSI